MQGVEDGKGEALAVRLNDLAISRCQACGSGWGNCRKNSILQVYDDFQVLHKQICEADGFVVVTPVYWCFL